MTDEWQGWFEWLLRKFMAEGFLGMMSGGREVLGGDTYPLPDPLDAYMLQGRQGSFLL